MITWDGFSVFVYDRTGTLPLCAPGRLVAPPAFTTAAKGGFKDLRLSLAGHSADLLNWYYLLGQWMVLVGPDNSRCWEGQVTTLKFSHGVSYNLALLYNAVKLQYSDTGGAVGETAWATNDVLIGRYGRREYVGKVYGVPLPEAERRRDLLLYFTAHSLALDPFAAPGPPPPRYISVEVGGLGWYGSLANLRYVPASPTSGPGTDTGQQVRDILTAFVALNPWLSWDTVTVPNTGVVTDVAVTGQYPTSQQEVERLAMLGNSSNQALWPQVWRDRIFQLQTWAGGDFPAPDYYDQGDRILDAAGIRIPDWQVRADGVIVGNSHLAEGYGTIRDPLDSPTGGYIIETEYVVGRKPQPLLVKTLGWTDFVALMGAA